MAIEQVADHLKEWGAHGEQDDDEIHYQDEIRYQNGYQIERRDREQQYIISSSVDGWQPVVSSHAPGCLLPLVGLA
jgi:hypothetical protein